MTIRLGHLNSFLIFGVIPWLALIVPSVFMYLLMLIILVINRRFALFLAVLLAAVPVYFVVETSLARAYLTEKQLLNTYNTSFAIALLFILPFVRKSFTLTANRTTDASLVLFFLVIAFLRLTGVQEYNALAQILAVTFALYFCFADKAERKILVIAYLIFSSARSIIAGFAVAWLVQSIKFLRSAVSLPVLLAVIIFTASGSVVAILYDYLTALRGDQVMLKGRTNMWLAILDSAPGLFGNGPGAALVLLENVLRYFQLPHNDWLRIYSDFGLVGLLAALTAMFYISRKGANSRFATFVLAFYMLTGNPLSFPTVIATYFLVCQTGRRQENVAASRVMAQRTEHERSFKFRLRSAS